jgi:hypothetical protein
MVDGRDQALRPLARRYRAPRRTLEPLSALEHNVMIFQPFSAI